MPAIEVRPFRRSDRDQLTHLMNGWYLRPCVEDGPEPETRG